ncbi:MFS transporter [Auritidibacter sp. NML130574]|uniref:MFS transporter n=1 Tax=Auritidibacter sp. NML130574 TaxID=2170745 RepID=UPI000D72FEE5|nr:MFS transporter [Auritidibacter sp. NML130574]AXR73920.1 MFS transporter [Auritidibacter sp. NML130574]
MTRLQAETSTPGQRWAFLAIISAALFLVGADNSILYTALPVLRDELGTSELQGLWIINAYPLVLSGLLLGTGTLGDKIGHRLMFLLGVSIFGAGSLLAAFSPNAWTLIVARATLGVGAATMMPASLALVRLTFRDVKERNVAVAIWGSVAVVGAASGPVLGGLLLEFFWWGSVFLLNVPIVIITVIATIAVAPPNVAHPERHWDLMSSLLMMFAMAGFVMSIKELANPQRNAWVLSVALVIAVIGFVLFWLRQRLLTHPLLELSIFRDPVFTGGTLTAVLIMVVVSGVELMTTQRFQTAGGLTPLQAGAMVAAVALPAIPTALLGGSVLHRVGFRPLITGGFLLIVVGLGVSMWTFTLDVVPLFLGSMILVGLGGGLATSASSTAILGSAPPSKAGMASSVEAVSYEFGTLVAVAVFGSVMPLLYSMNAPAPVAADVDHGVDHPMYGEQAVAAYDQAYLSILGIVATVGLIGALVTAWCFRGNPKEADATE